MLFMIIERFKNRDPAPIYARFREQGHCILRRGLALLETRAAADTRAKLFGTARRICAQRESFGKSHGTSMAIQDRNRLRFPSAGVRGAADHPE